MPAAARPSPPHPRAPPDLRTQAPAAVAPALPPPSRVATSRATALRRESVRRRRCTAGRRAPTRAPPTPGELTRLLRSGCRRPLRRPELHPSTEPKLSSPPLPRRRRSTSHPPSGSPFRDAAAGVLARGRRGRQRRRARAGGGGEIQINRRAGAGDRTRPGSDPNPLILQSRPSNA
jgi:hypothetical protein